MRATLPYPARALVTLDVPGAEPHEGFELQIGTNHFGHFALAGRLLPLVHRTPGSRVEVASSTTQNFGRIDFDDLKPGTTQLQRERRLQSEQACHHDVRARTAP